MPAVSYKSFTAIGIPSIGLIGFPCSIRVSADLACVRASDSVTNTNELRMGFVREISDKV